MAAKDARAAPFLKTLGIGQGRPGNSTLDK
jgi:hypothetical protein